ncbi:hypothetical protein K2173_025802 [Erythroxylum novogranatense]|uniref:DUF4283 domain-containing protein n=1 Tax=Erythroxylum novogranatense TaxID=1862640 RepID=A0AAV8SHR3_9ROSI|nr:hypothetical protein K2173_025802 [Erythroxylum novogranatense]
MEGVQLVPCLAPIANNIQVGQPFGPALTKTTIVGPVLSVIAELHARPPPSFRDCLEVSGKWKDALIVKFYGRSVNFTYLENRLNLLWKPYAELDLIDLEFSFYLAKFEEKEDMLRIVSDGPNIVGVQSLYIQKWKPPANAVGTPIKVDRQMFVATRGRFARVYVELNPEQPLAPKEKTVSNTITENWYESLQVENSVFIKVDKGLVGPRKRISSVSGLVGPRGKGKKLVMVKGIGRFGSEKGQFQPGPTISRPIPEGPMIVNRRKEALEVGQSSGLNVEGIVSDALDQILIVESQVPSILSAKVPVLPMIDNVGGGVVAKFVLNEPKPPNPIAGDVIM